MRRVLNRLLFKKGYEIVKIGKAPYLLEQLLKEKKSSLKFLQIGANDGVSFDTLFEFVTTKGCRGVVVEPLPAYFEKLALNYRSYPLIRPVQLAIHPTEESFPIYSVSQNKLGAYPTWVNGIASFDRTHLIRHGVDESDISQESVSCMSLMRLVQQFDLLDMDYLQVDTEGFDFEVLSQLDFSKVSPSLIKFERVHMSQSNYSLLKINFQKAGYRIIEDGRDGLALIDR